MLRTILCTSLLLALSVCTLALPTLAKIDEGECEQIRALADQQPQEIFFKTERGFFPLDAANAGELLRYLRQRHPKETKFIYLAKAEGDDRPTEFIVQQIFVTDNSWKSVGTYNNVRNSPRYVDFDIYQNYHTSGIPNRELSEWFHIGPSLTDPDLVNSNRRPFPREFFAFPIIQQDGRELRTYLLAVTGLRDDGSCIDFSPSIPASIKELRFVIRNIRQLEFGGYPPPLSAEQKFDDQ